MLSYVAKTKGNEKICYNEMFLIYYEIFKYFFITVNN